MHSGLASTAGLLRQGRARGVPVSEDARATSAAMARPRRSMPPALVESSSAPTAETAEAAEGAGAGAEHVSSCGAGGREPQAELGDERVFHGGIGGAAGAGAEASN